MTNFSVGPPESERPAPPQDRPSHRVTDTPQLTAKSDNKPGSALVWIPCTRPPVPQDTRSQLARRRDAARRLAPLDCGCRDGWPCRCTLPPLSDKMIDAGRDAALHILESGRVPLLEIEILQALWRRGGTERQLATMLFEATGGQVA